MIGILDWLEASPPKFRVFDFVLREEDAWMRCLFRLEEPLRFSEESSMLKINAGQILVSGVVKCVDNQRSCRPGYRLGREHIIVAFCCEPRWEPPVFDRLAPP